MASHNPVLYRSYLLSLMLGIVQLHLAWRGHLLRDSTWLKSSDGITAPWFGYISTFNWWVSYLVTIPIMIACSADGLTVIWRLARDRVQSRRAVLLAIAIATALATFFVVRELGRSISNEPTEWAQWNDLLVQPAHNWSPRYRLALHITAYSHYFIAYVLSLSCLFAALAILTTIAYPRSPAARDSPRHTISEVLLDVRLIVGGYLVYLVLLRSTKVGQWLTFRHEPAALDKVYGFLLDARPYFEASREGIFLNIVLGLLWAGICFVAHVLAAPLFSTLTEDSATVQGAFERLRAGYALLGRIAVGFFGLVILGIILPPPSGWHLVAVIGTAFGAFLVRRAFRGSQ